MKEKEEINEDYKEKNKVNKNLEIEGNKILVQLASLVDPVNTPLAFGPKIIKFNWIINAQKTGTIFVMFLLMVIYGYNH